MTLAQSPRRPIVTATIIAINVLLYLVQVTKGVDWREPSPEMLLAWGANLAAYTLDDQPWRLLASMFLHVGLLHLAVNMYMLTSFGGIVERRFGHVRFLLVYLLSGMTGSLVSALTHTDPLHLLVSAGASGALMGLCGAYLAAWMLARHRHASHEELGIRGPLVQTVAINLALGAFIPGVDNASHIGGLLGGFVIGGALLLVPEEANLFKRTAANVIVSCLALFGIGAALRAEPSEGLAAIKEQRATERAERDEKDRAEQEKIRLAQQIADARKRGPRVVSEELAAGTTIALPAPVSSLVLMPDGKRIALTGDVDNTLRFVDLSTGTVGATVQGRRTNANQGDCDGRCIPNNANAVALTADGRTAYVASLVTNGVGIVDLEAGKMTASFLTGKQPRAIALNRAADRAYVLNDGDNTVVAVDLRTRKIVGKPLVVSTNELSRYHPVGLWLATDDKELWVMDESLSRLRVYDAATLAELGEVTVTSGFMNGVHVDAQRGKVWLVGVDALDLIDMRSRKIEQATRYCYGVLAAPVAINQDGSLLAIAEPRGSVRIINLHTAATMAAYPYKGKPNGLRFSPDGKQLYFISDEPARLSVFDTSVTQALDKLLKEEPPELLCAPLY